MGEPGKLPLPLSPRDAAATLARGEVTRPSRWLPLGCLQGLAVLRVFQRDPTAVPTPDPMQAILPGGADQVPVCVTGQ